MIMITPCIMVSFYYSMTENTLAKSVHVFFFVEYEIYYCADSKSLTCERAPVRTNQNQGEVVE